MSLAELLPTLKQLERADKLRAVQFLVAELAKDEGLEVIAPQVTYSVWSPYNAFEAGDVLLAALAKDTDVHG